MSKVCKICKTENDDSEYLCQYCSAYLDKFPRSLKHTLIALLFWPWFIYATYIVIIDTLKMRAIREKNGIDNFFEFALMCAEKNNSGKKQRQNANNQTEINESYCSYFISCSNYRKKDGNIIKGDCEIEFKDDLFLFRQGNEIIENPISSIYYFGIWEYKDYTYFKFRMRSLTEYTFSSQHFEADEIADLLMNNDIKVEDDRE